MAEGTGIISCRCGPNIGDSVDLESDDPEDRGRGVSDIDTALTEFHTDSGPVVAPDGRLGPVTEGLGCGLSAVQRLMDSVAILSRPGRGTIVRALKRIKPL